MITIERLVKRFGTRTVLDDVSVSFATGKVSAIVGASGGGKSTLLRCINGLETFDAGAIRVGALAVSREPAQLQKVRLQVGMVFHCSTSLREVGQYGTTFSETIVITNDGCEVLTDVPRELVIK